MKIDNKFSATRSLIPNDVDSLVKNQRTSELKGIGKIELLLTQKCATKFKELAKDGKSWNLSSKTERKEHKQHLVFYIQNDHQFDIL